MEQQNSNKFTPPTINEIQEYMDAKGYLNSKKESILFYNFYTSKNWMIGMNKMKSWKASINNWGKMKIIFGT